MYIFRRLTARTAALAISCNHIVYSMTVKTAAPRPSQRMKVIRRTRFFPSHSVFSFSLLLLLVLCSYFTRRHRPRSAKQPSKRTHTDTHIHTQTLTIYRWTNEICARKTAHSHSVAGSFLRVAATHHRELDGAILLLFQLIPDLAQPHSGRSSTRPTDRGRPSNRATSSNSASHLSPSRSECAWLCHLPSVEYRSVTRSWISEEPFRDVHETVDERTTKMAVTCTI